MTDIMIKDGKLPLTNGDLTLVNGIEEVKQHIIVAVNTFYGDWILDYTRGIDFSFGMRHNEFLEHDIKKQILLVKGVKSIEAFEMKLDRVTLVLTITVAVNTIHGRLDFESRIMEG